METAAGPAPPRRVRPPRRSLQGPGGHRPRAGCPRYGDRVAPGPSALPAPRGTVRIGCSGQRCRSPGPAPAEQPPPGRAGRRAGRERPGGGATAERGPARQERRTPRQRPAPTQQARPAGSAPAAGGNASVARRKGRCRGQPRAAGGRKWRPARGGASGRAGAASGASDGDGGDGEDRGAPQPW